jgi:hypothetical protein
MRARSTGETVRSQNFVYCLKEILQKMTVFELISELTNLPPDLKVVVRGYENGYNEIRIETEINFTLDFPETYFVSGKYPTLKNNRKIHIDKDHLNKLQ